MTSAAEAEDALLVLSLVVKCSKSECPEDKCKLTQVMMDGDRRALLDGGKGAGSANFFRGKVLNSHTLLCCDRPWVVRFLPGAWILAGRKGSASIVERTLLH